MYSMTKDEIAKGIANRFVHSRAYILLYLAMAALSVTTVVLSLVNGCPTLPFYILELIINGAFNTLSPEQCAGLLSCFVFTEKVHILYLYASR